jgi:hypothetical protein
MLPFSLRTFGLSLALVASGCTGADGGAEGVEETSGGPSGPQLRIVVDVDPDQVRLDNFGEPASAPPDGHAAATPEFMFLGAHSAELVPDEFTALGGGANLFDSPHQMGGVDFAELPITAPGGELASANLSTIPPGTYRYLRVSVSFQRFRVPGWADFGGMEVTTPIEVAAFVEGETYIDSYELGDETVQVGEVKAQGYFGAWSQYTGVVEGQAPVGATTVPNPLDSTSPIPVGSCVVTGVFDEPLVITGEEGEDLSLRVSFSTNDSFEWIDSNGDGKWQPFDDMVVDMGVRGMVIELE